MANFKRKSKYLTGKKKRHELLGGWSRQAHKRDKIIEPFDKYKYWEPLTPEEELIASGKLKGCADF